MQIQAKRIFDILISAIGLVITSPIVLCSAIAVFYHDKKNPFYIAKRTGLNGEIFSMVKIRTMVIGADSNKVDSTSVTDPRLTSIGKALRTYKLDELPQLLNVLKGEMSFVGPRPNVKRETDLYTIEERKLLSVTPGITDFSSIVFADLGEILRDSDNPNATYNELVRPWKSRMSLIYVKNQSFFLDILLICTTLIGLFSRPLALKLVSKELEGLGADQEIVKIARRTSPLFAAPPPGSNEISSQRSSSDQPS